MLMSSRAFLFNQHLRSEVQAVDVYLLAVVSGEEGDGSTSGTSTTGTTDSVNVVFTVLSSQLFPPLLNRASERRSLRLGNRS